MSAAPELGSRRFSIAHLALLIPWVALVIDAWGPVRDNSFLWHVRAGTVQMAAREVLTADPFSFTASGEPWRTQSWLAELLYAWGEDLFAGLGFVPIMILATSVVAFAGIALIGYRHSRSVTTTVLLLVLSTILLISFLVPRPVIFSFALFPLVILAWDQPRLRFAVPFLFWIWAAVHGSFIIGLGWIGLSLIARREWQGLPVAVVSGLATLLTAHGLGVISVLIDFSQAGEALSLLSEWRKPELTSPVFAPFVVAIVIVVIGAVRRRIEPHHLILASPFLLLGLSSTRGLPPAWIAIIPLLAISLAGMWQGLPKRFTVVASAMVALIVLTLPFLFIEGFGIDDERFPVAAVDALAPVKTFHDDVAGGYLIWSRWPENEVYIDDRAELYDQHLVEFVAVRDGEQDWRPVFEREGIEQVLLRADARLVAALQDAGWDLVHEGEHFVVLR